MASVSVSELIEKMKLVNLTPEMDVENIRERAKRILSHFTLSSQV